MHRFGSDTLTLGDPFTLCVPSTPGGPIDHYVCHAASGGGLGGSHAIADEFQTQSVELGAPAAFCMPAGVDGAALLHPLAYVACYESTPAGAAGGVVPIGNAFHDTTLDVGLPNAVCIPALALVSRTP